MSYATPLKRCLLAILAVGWPGSALASDEEAARRSLTGIPMFRVVVEQVGSNVQKRTALKVETLQADVERRLADAGIPVSESADAILYANVAVVCGVDCAFTVTVEVQQRVRLERKSPARSFLAPTWSTSGTGLVARRSNVIRQSLRDQVDQFVGAYRAANPTK
jgi:NADH/NAD ratio-sensing transcriptional regulator Rex